MQIIGLSGKAGAGKDYIIQTYLRPRGFYQISFAWHMKVWIVGRGLATYEEVFVTKPKHVRELMQLEGTERGRDVFGENVWVDSAMAWMRLYKDNWGIDKFVVGDVRFPNERQAILDHGGRVARVVAPERTLANPLTPEQRQHPSETALDGLEWDYKIRNDIDIPDWITTKDVLDLLDI